MTVKFEFYLSGQDFDKLCVIKEKEGGLDSMSLNDYAKRIIEREIYRLHPHPYVNPEDEA